MNKISFSRIIAGTMTWGVWGKNWDNAGMIKLIATCLDNQITSFDHADIYGAYTTEEAFGKAFRTGGFQRDKAQFISKCGIKLLSEERCNTIKHYDYSHQHIIQSVEQSLKNLQTDYLDLILLHRPSPLMMADEIAEAVEKLKKEGKILDLGVSNFTPSQTELLSQKIQISVNQIQFSITHFDAMLDGSLDYMQTHQVIPMSWSPLGTVFKKDNETSLRIRKKVGELSMKYNVPEDVILIAWIVKHPAGIIPVCGTSDTSRINHLMQSYSLDMELQDWFSLWTESAGKPVP